MASKIGVVGATGRTGRVVVEKVLSDASLQLGAAIVSPQSSSRGEIVPGSGGVKYSDDLELLNECDGVIDFSVVSAAKAVAALCGNARTPLLLATTGLTESDKNEIRGLCEGTALCCTSNTSLGATVLSILAAEASKLLGPEFDCEVVEMHHRMKKDAPSGTAKMVVDQIISSRQENNAGSGGIQPIFGREGLRKKHEIGLVSLRGGDEPGEHTVYYFGPSERIEISHKVKDRAVFAIGALTLLQRLMSRGAGVYTPRDLLMST